LLKAIGAAIPGACATYGAVGNGVDMASMPLEMMPDHSACVQKDLGRKDGPGGTYGRGAWRAAEGAVALWKDTARALKDGIGVMSGKPRATVEAKLNTIDETTAKIELKKVPREDAWIQDMSQLHADAGAPMGPDAGGNAIPQRFKPDAAR
jgi:hypothetical protein